MISPNMKRIHSLQLTNTIISQLVKSSFNPSDSIIISLSEENNDKMITMHESHWKLCYDIEELKLTSISDKNDDFKKYIDLKFEELKEYIDQRFEIVDDEITDIKTKIQILESKILDIIRRPESNNQMMTIQGSMTTTMNL